MAIAAAYHNKTFFLSSASTIFDLLDRDQIHFERTEAESTSLIGSNTCYALQDIEPFSISAFNTLSQ